MEGRLVSWARAVKSRRRSRAPVMWLFTDPVRMPDVVAVVRALPPGCGVVFRHDGVSGRSVLARAVLAACRAGRHWMAMTPPRIAGAGLHMRAGRRPDARALPNVVTSSAHSRMEVARARRAGAAVVFLSPLFTTASHPGAAGLGRLRWSRAGRGYGGLYALGGVSGRTIRAVPPDCPGFGAIGAMVDCGPFATVFRDCHGEAYGTVADRGVPRQ